MKKKRKVKLGEVDFILICTILILLGIGLVMVFSASSWNTTVLDNDPMYYFKKQLLWSGIGLFFMVVAMLFDYHKIKRFTSILMVVCAFLLFVVFKFGAVNGATRWIDLGFASLQPSEIVKYAVVFYLAKNIERKGEKIEDFWHGVVPCFAVAVTYAGLILLEKNLSISAVIVMVTLIILFSAGAKIWQILSFIIPSVAAGLFFIFSTPYRKDRALFFMNPWQDAAGKGYQLVQSLLALGSGGIMGVGLGQSRQKAFYMPEAHTDFIFSVIGEELGLIGCIIVITLFIVLIWRGIRAAINARDTYGTIIAVGITSIIAIQAIINIAVVSGSMPVTGVPLPFISYGGSSLVVNLVAMGILLNITRQSKKDVGKK